ncbi:MAG: sugar transferase [Actinobacteria bacterium]|nr:sugar transferase [Actinomycetota bacterium]
MIEHSVTTANPLPVAPPLDALTRREQLAARTRLAPDTSWILARFSLDATMLAAAALASSLGSRAAGVEASPAGWLALFSVIVAVTFAARGMYRPRLRAEILDDLRGVIVATSLGAMAVLTLRELLTEPPDLSAQVIRPWAFATVYVAAGRVALHWSRTQARRHGEALRPTVIVGAGRVGRLTAKRLLEQPELGLQPIGFLDKEPMDAPETGVFLPVLGASWDLDRVIAEHEVQQVIVTFSTAPSEVLLRLVRRCEELGVHVAFVPRLFERMSQRLTIDYLGGLPLVVARWPNPKGIQFATKYAADRVVAAVLLLLVSPFLIGAALAVWASLGRPIFFRQRRIGRDGREFEMLKFRTMRGTPEHGGEADAAWAREELGTQMEEVSAHSSTPADDRRTRVGRLLRAFSIDELPQLLNVLKGDMSIVGPRPERTHYVRLFEQSVYRYGERHRVKAGITGWAQVNGLRGKTSLADRVEWDNHYIENWSLWLDFKILLFTGLAVLRFSRQAE